MKGIVSAAMLAGGILMMACSQSTGNEADAGRRRVLLLGASVGHAWNFPELPRRMGDTGFVFEMVPHYRCDKGPALEEILMRPKRKFKATKTYLLGFFKPNPRKPDILLIKQCAAYFPRDIAETAKMTEGWISRAKAAGMEPMLTTIVPVTEEHSRGKPGRLEAILKYNDWVHEYAAKHGMKVLDLEKPLRVSDQDRHLRPDLTDGDGLHLNPKAYALLDQAVLPVLR